MSFVEPWALLLLGSIPVILILYSLRPWRRRVVLSTLFLWQEALRERQRGMGLQRLLRDISLLLILAAALALSLGLADPRWLTRVAEQGDTVLVLDVSAGMKARHRGVTRFAQARRRAADLIDRLPKGARMLLMTAGRYPKLRTAFEEDREKLHRVLADIQPTDEAGRPREALALALSLMRNRERDRVYFISDGAFDEDWGAEFENASIRYLPVGGPGRNVGITRFDFRREVGRDDRFQLLLVVRNYTEEEVEVPVSVTLGRNRLEERRLTLAPRERRVLVIPYRGLPVGRAQARLEHDDDLEADNRAYAVLSLEENLWVLLFTKGNFYLESVLAALPNVALTKLGEVAPSTFARQVREHDIVIFDGVEAPRLPPGNYLLINTVAPGLPFAPEGRVARPRVLGKGTAHLVRHLDPAGLKIDEALRLKAPADEPRVQRLFWAEETDLALTYLDEDVRLVYLGFDLARSNLPLRAAFPVFFNQSVSWLRPRASRFAVTQVPAGEPYTVELPAAQKELVVRTPSNRRLRYAVEAGSLLFSDTSEAGIYGYAVGRDRHYFAVNLTDEGESDITPRAKLPAAEDQTARAGVLSRVARPLWPYLAWIAALLLAGEWFWWCRRRRGA